MLRTSMPKKPTAIILILVLSIALRLTTLLAIRPQKESGPDYQNIIHNSREFTPKKEYDYIVVGGGTAGCPLAATLSEKHSVLLLERGGTSDENPYVLRQENMLLTLLLADNNNSAAETFVSEDGVRNARARILGGGTLVNFAFYSRANPEFYEKSGIEWDMDVVNESYEWVEETIVFRADKLSDWASSFRDSLLEAGVTPNNGYTLDHKVGTKQSGTIFDSNGLRHGADELLKKANSNNLDVVIHTTVDRIIFSNSPVLSAVGIIYRDSNGNSHEVRVHGNGEVILSTGALGTPQLLLLSGVGPNSYLSSLDIPVVQDQPFVGEFMCDNPRNSFYLDNPFPAASAGNPIVGITKDATYIESISGTLPFFSPFGFALFHNTSIPSLNVSMVGIVSKFSQPLSKGWLKLASATNASTNPVVRFNYFARQEDLSQCVNGMHVYENMLKTNALEKYMFQDLFQGKHFKFLGTPFPVGQGDDALETFCHDTLMTFYHYHGGCLVDKVVDNQLKVKGIKALRIVDGSILTLSPGTNPQATLMMLGRYIGLKIQEEKRKGNVFDERPFGIFRSSLRISSVV